MNMFSCPQYIASVGPNNEISSPIGGGWDKQRSLVDAHHRLQCNEVMSAIFTRRRLLAIAAAGGCAVAANKLLSRLRGTNDETPELAHSVDAGPSRFWQGTSQYPRTENHTKYIAYKVDASGSDYVAIECGTNAHSIQSIPHSNRSLAISRRLPNLSVVDWDLKKETLLVSLPEGQTFYGHGTPLYSDETFTGKYAISGAIDYPKDMTKSAVIYELDIHSGAYSVLGTLPSSTIHELYAIDENTFMIGLSGTSSSAPTIGIFDRRTKKLEILPTPLANDPGRGIAHCVPASDNVVVWTSNAGSKVENGPLTDAALLFVNYKTRTIVDFRFDGKLAQSELLSIAYDDETKRLWMTFPDVSRIVVFSLTTHKIELVEQLLHPATYVLVNTDETLAPKNAVICGSFEAFTTYDRRSLKKIRTIQMPSLPDRPISPHARWHTTS